MRSAWTMAALGALLAGPALAAPSVEIKDAAARVIVVPEARSDVAVQVLSTNSGLPLKVRAFGTRAVVDGGLRRRIVGCSTMFGKVMVRIRGLGEVSYDNLPQIVVRIPLDVRVGVSGAVFGSVGRARSLELSTEGCGDWTVANVDGPLRINDAGSGDVRAGRAGELVVRVAGSGNVSARDIAGPAAISIAGSGDVTAGSISGDLRADVTGSGDVKVAGGHAPHMLARVAGSGDIDFEGVADQLSASIAGSGDVDVARVTGPVHRTVFGSGEVNIGH